MVDCDLMTNTLLANSFFIKYNMFFKKYVIIRKMEEKAYLRYIDAHNRNIRVNLRFFNLGILTYTSFKVHYIERFDNLHSESLTLSRNKD